MTLHPNQTVREIAVAAPATVRVFESLSIDYCCGGNRTLEEACERAGVPLAGALAQLAEAASGAAPEASDWSRASCRELIAHIVGHHHRYVRAEAPRLLAMLDKVVARHGEANPELAAIRVTFAGLAQELFTHLMKEENVLFPYVERMEAAAVDGAPLPRTLHGSVEMPIQVMLADHEEAGSALSRIRGLSSDFVPPESACPTYRGLYAGLAEFEQDLHRHIHLENNLLFPRALELERGAAIFAHGCR